MITALITQNNVDGGFVYLCIQMWKVYITGHLGGVYLLAVDNHRLHISYASLGAFLACCAFEHIIFI